VDGQKHSAGTSSGGADSNEIKDSATIGDLPSGQSSMVKDAETIGNMSNDDNKGEGSMGGGSNSEIEDSATIGNLSGGCNDCPQQLPSPAPMMNDAKTIGNLSSGNLNEDTRNQLLNKVSSYDELHQILDKFRNLVDTSTYANDSSVNKVTTVPSGSIIVYYLWNPDKVIREKYSIMMLKFTNRDGELAKNEFFVCLSLFQIATLIQLRNYPLLH
jgi:hypothetical protein